MTTKALLLENIHPDASARLAKQGYQVDTLSRALGEDELIEAIGDVNLLGIRSGTQITERVLEAAPSLVRRSPSASWRRPRSWWRSALSASASTRSTWPPRAGAA